MKRDETSSQLNSFVMLPEATLRKLIENQERMIELLEGDNSVSKASDQYLTQKQAEEFLGRKATWFWNERTKGRLPFHSVGRKIYYARKDLIALVESNRKEAFR